jgi:hypothetical protein
MQHPASDNPSSLDKRTDRAQYSFDFGEFWHFFFADKIERRAMSKSAKPQSS